MAGKLRRRTVPEEKVVDGTESEPSPKTGFAIGKIVLVIVVALVSSAGGAMLSFVLLGSLLRLRNRRTPSKRSSPSWLRKALYFRWSPSW